MKNGKTKNNRRTRTTLQMRILAWVLAFVLSVPWNSITIAQEADAPASDAALTSDANTEFADRTSDGDKDSAQPEVSVISAGGTPINVPMDDEVEENGDVGTVFSPLGLMGPYTVSFYQQDPESEDAPENNLIEEYTGVEYNTRLGVQIKKLQEEHPEYAGVKWSEEAGRRVTNNIALYASDGVAKIGEETYPTLGDALAEVSDGETIELLDDVNENVSVDNTSDNKSFTLDMGGHTVSPKEGNTTDSIFKITGGNVTLRNGTITGASITGNRNGGGIYAENANVTLSSVQIMDNVVSGSGSNGGGIYVRGGSLKTEAGTVISGNKADGSGAGIYLEQSSFVAEYTTINGNENTGNGSDDKGGGLYAGKGCEVTFHVGCQVKDNSCAQGGGIYFKGNKLTAVNGLVVSGNTSTNRTSGLYLEGSADLKGVEFSENRHTGSEYTGAYGALCLWDNDAVLNAENCTFTDNSSTSAVVYISSGSAVFTGCNFTGNTATDGSTILLGANTTFTNCRIEGNIAKSLFGDGYSAGGLAVVSNGYRCSYYDMFVDVQLNNTVITDNSGSLTGGILAYDEYADYTSASYVHLTVDENSAIYGNTTTDSNNGNDLWLPYDAGYAEKCSIWIPGAAKMHDGDKDFSKYSWNDTRNGIVIKEDLDGYDLYRNATIPYDNGTYKFYLTAGPENRTVAKNKDTDVLCETVTKAVTNTEDGDTILLTAGDEDNTGKTITEDVVIPEGKDITIDLNKGHTLQGKSGTALTVSENASLKLTGDGSVLARGTGAYAILNKGSLTIDDGVNAPSVDHSGDSLILNGKTQVKKVRLAEGKFITAGEGFEISDKMTIILAGDVLKKLNSTEAADPEPMVTLIEGYNLDETLPGKITLPGANGLVIVKKIERSGEKDRIVAVRLTLNGVYLDGIHGTDPSEENNGSELGLTRDYPVKTFEAAKKILEEKNKELSDGEKLDGIYVMDTVTVSGSANWSLDGDAKLMRDPLFKGELIRISGGTLNLENITIDGKDDLLKVSSALIYLSGGTLNIRAGATLTNNDRTLSADCGGAVEAYNADVTMTGGSVSDNHAWHGGGICLFGEGCSFEMSGGSITGNGVEGTAISGAEPDNAGGGVAVLSGAIMTMSGGSISDNTAYVGAGICVGGKVTSAVGNGGAKLTMTNGTVSGNIAEHEGGGIYVQSANTAEVSGGSITKNQSHGGRFGGGGFYVNGPRTVLGKYYPSAKLYLYNAEITGNSVKAGDIFNNGGGFAGCETSMTYVYPNSTAIYANTAYGGSNDVLLDKDPSQPGNPVYEVSGFMYDGTPYHWKDADGNELSASRYQNNQTKLVLHTDAKPGENGSVLISGNTSDTRGGGIGSNGTVYFGSKPETTSISVTKTWTDTGYEQIRPDSIDIWLLRNKERVEYQTVKKQEDGSWPGVTFTDLPINDSAGETYVYTVEEELSEDDAPHYKSTVLDDAATSYTIDNQLVGELSISKTTINNISPKDKGKEFTFTVELKKGDEPFVGFISYEKVKSNDGSKIESGVPEVLEFKEGDEGKKNITLADGQTIILKELPYDLIYTVTEAETPGYTVKVGGVKMNSVSGQIVSGEGSETKFNTALAFTNTYTVEPTAATIEGTKVLTGRGWKEDDKFEFELTETTKPEKDASGKEKEIPDALKDSLTAEATKASQNFSFGPIPYTAPGTHTYKVAEKDTTIGGITKDAAVYTVTVAVTDKGTGTLEAEVTSYERTTKDAEGRETTAKADSMTFTNIYKAGSTTATIGGTKELTGREWKEGDKFEFELTETTQPEKDAGGKEKEIPDALKDSLTAEATMDSQNFSFKPIPYTVPGAHTYKVAEKDTTIGGITKDAAVYTVTVTVTDKGDGTLEAKVVSYERTAKDAEGKETTAKADSMTFTNIYKAGSTTATIEGTKVLTGREWKEDDKFEFELTETTQPEKDASGKEKEIPDALKNSLTAEATMDSQNFSFEPIPYTVPGTHTYRVAEKDTAIGGVVKDAAVYKVTVTVKDNGDGTLSAETAYLRTETDAEGKETETEAGKAAFTNVYTTGSTTATVAGTKVLTGREWTDTDAFTFELTETTQPSMDGSGNGTEIPDKLTETRKATATKAAKDFNFGTFEYTEPYVHTYEVRETSPSGKGITADTSVYVVTVAVTDDGEGKLAVSSTVAKNDVPADAIIFTNTYTAEGGVILSGTKLLTGGREEPMHDNEFHFILRENGNVIEKAGNHADGSITFSELHYTLADVGEHVYEIAEDKENEKRVTYSEKTFTVRVIVTDNFDGTLNTQVEYPEGGVTFENVYTPKKSEKTEEHIFGNLDVTKLLYASEGHPLIANDTRFYVALFSDEARTQRISEVKTLHYSDSAAETVTFDNLQLDTTYYVGETDEYGILKGSGVIDNATYLAEYPDGYAVQMTKKHNHGHVAIHNTFYEIPQGFYYGGELTITKKVQIGGKDHATDEVFYAGVFTDAALTKREGDVIALWMEGASKASQILPVHLGTSGTETVTYYVAETDEHGNVLDPDSGLAFTISLDHESVQMSVTDFQREVVITNDFVEESPETETEIGTEDDEPETKNVPAGAETPKTGDGTPIGIYLLLLAVSFAVMWTGIFKRRERE